MYIIVKPGNTTDSVTDGRLALEWFPWTKVGIGGQYKYNRYRCEREAQATDLAGRLTYQGAQVYISFRF